ncbi:MAG: HAD-IA family hydrolase [Polyangiaceae bacterium]|nr:HAD-IA family hydrolase [Polyangiaceae bacterium]
MRGVVFDLDGTLVDSRADIVASCRYALGAHGLPIAAEATIVGAVGDGARRLLGRVTGLPEDAPAFSRLLATYLEYYAAHGYARTVFMPETVRALDALAHLPLAIATNKPRATTHPLLAHLGIADRFAVVVTGDDFTRHKPDPKPLLGVAERLGIEPRALVMVGDGPQDVLCGRGAGARTVGIPGCFIPRERLLAAAPDVLLRDLGELPEVVRTWQHQATRA